MVKDILTAAGVLYKQGSFPRAPGGNYAVYFDDIEVTGPDRTGAAFEAGQPRVCKHDVTVELYEPVPDDAIEAAIEAELDARGTPWTKQDRYWVENAQRYQVIYEFTYYTKRRT